MSNKQDDRRRSDNMDYLFGLLAMDCRRQTAKSLLAGNDTQCFSTQQYLDTYIRDINKGDISLMNLVLARKHLESIPEIAVEVREDVWAGRDIMP